jgi:hypothetical protein
MANPNTYEMLATRPGRVAQHLQFTVGSAGAVGTVTGGQEVKSVTGPANTSDYTVNLNEAWERVENIQVWFVGAVDATKGQYAKVITDNTGSTSTPGFTFTVQRPDTGAAALPATGDVMHVTFDLAYLP